MIAYVTKTGLETVIIMNGCILRLCCLSFCYVRVCGYYNQVLVGCLPRQEGVHKSTHMSSIGVDE